MRTIFATLAITFAVFLIARAVVVYSGVYDIGATAPHWRITHWVMETVRVRSIKAHAAGITVPSGVNDPARIPMGTGSRTGAAGRCFIARRAFTLTREKGPAATRPGDKICIRIS